MSDCAKATSPSEVLLPVPFAISILSETSASVPSYSGSRVARRVASVSVLPLRVKAAGGVYEGTVSITRISAGIERLLFTSADHDVNANALEVTPVTVAVPVPTPVGVVNNCGHDLSGFAGSTIVLIVSRPLDGEVPELLTNW